MGTAQQSWRALTRTIDAAAPSVAAFQHVMGSTSVWLDSAQTSSAHYENTCSILYPAGGPAHVVVEGSLHHGTHSAPGASPQPSPRPPSMPPSEGETCTSDEASVAIDGPIPQLFTRWTLDGRGPLVESLRSTISPSSTVFDVISMGLSGVNLKNLPTSMETPCPLGWVGVLGYELKHHLDEVRASATRTALPHASDTPDALLLLADRAIVFDHAANTTTIWALTCEEPSIHAEQQRWLDTTERVMRQLAESTPSTPPKPTTPTTPDHAQNLAQTRPPVDAQNHAHRTTTARYDHSRTDYLEAIASAQEMIAAGDTYELCLTTTAEAPPLADPLATYLRLRALSPAPYGAYLRFGDLHVLSSSPERFLTVDPSRTVSAKPIKGTRPRGRSLAQDDALKHDVRISPKDRAENLMIVDLLRNDLARVALPGSVRVPVLFDVETYSHVHQLVSTITAELAPDKSVADLLRAAFPGGSMTGAPKVRTMELIEQLERRARGLYSGCIGRIGFDGTADLSITIRTLIATTDKTTFGVGGAIVADSDPTSEWEEILVKASALLETLFARLEGASD